MLRTCNILAIVFFAVSLSCSSSKKNSQTTGVLPATSLHPYGRFIINKDQRLELISSAVHFGFSFEGKECQVFASIPDANGHNYLQYVLDGVYQKRIKIAGDVKQPVVLTTSNNRRHSLWIYKATEAHTGPIFISSVTGKNVRAIPNASLPLIEFIGNSITCGAAADASEVPCGTGAYHDQHNAYNAYGPRVARALGTNFILSSVSGIGAYRNWNSDGPAMPEVYEKADFQKSNQRLWDFSTYTPQVVSIALGTNDFSNGDGIKKRLPFDSAAFVESYIKFVRLVKSKYPHARIALLSSPMVGGRNGQRLENFILTVKQAIDAAYPDNKPVAVHFFKPMKAHGCTGTLM